MIARRTTRLSGAALAAALLVACSDAPSELGGNGSGAWLRVVNGATTPVSVFVDGTLREPSLAPGGVTPAFAFATGARQVELRPLGATAGATVQVDSRATETAVVAALATPAGALSAVALADTGAIPAPGTSKVQAIHLAAKAPPILVWRKQPDFPTPVRFMFPHPYGASTSYVQAPPGTWEIYVTPDGGDPSRSTLARLTLTLAANQARRVAVLDSGNTVRIVPLSP